MKILERFEPWLEKRYGRLLTPEELSASIDMSGVWEALGEYLRNPSHRQFPKGHIRTYDPTGVRTYVKENA